MLHQRLLAKACRNQIHLRPNDPYLIYKTCSMSAKLVEDLGDHFGMIWVELYILISIASRDHLLETVLILLIHSWLVYIGTYKKRKENALWYLKSTQ